MNDFFTRSLRGGARPPAINEPDNDRRAVQPADCRLSAFVNQAEAKRYWIKGKNYSLPALLGGDDLAGRFVGGSVVVHRLAPNDYHRFHCPMDCTWSKREIRKLGGDYYTVKPMAVRTTLDVFTDNVRQVVVLHSEQFGDVAYVIVGAVAVASIVITAEDGTLKKGDEIGYFAYGGSTLITCWQAGAIDLDNDLIETSRTGTETLVSMGDSLGVQPASR